MKTPRGNKKPVFPRLAAPEKPRASGGALRNFLWLVVVVLASFLQTTWPDTLKFQGVLPDLPLLLTVYFALADGEERAMFTGALGGLYQDVASGGVLGHHVLCLVLLGYFAGRFSTRLLVDHPAVKAGVVLVAGLFGGTLHLLVAYAQDPVSGFLFPLLTSAVPSAFFTALITPLAFLVLGWIFQRPKPVRGGLSP